MADWDDIECGFNAADETLFFGTRNIGGVDNLYETCTLASFRNNKEEEDVNLYKQLNIHTLIRNGFILFSINKTFRVFEDFSCSNLKHSVTFPEQIDAFCITHDCKYGIICVRDGTVYCFQMEDDFNTIYSENIIEHDNLDEPLFVSAFSVKADTLTFILVSTFGKIFRISIETEEPEKSSNFLLVDMKSSVNSVTFNDPILYIGSDDFYIINTQLNEIKSYNETNIKKIIPLNPRFVFNLGNNGKLNFLCTKMFLNISCNVNTLYDDIFLINNENVIHLLGISKRDETGCFYIQRLNYPDFSVIFSLKMATDIHLIIPEHIGDELIYISLIKSNNTVEELRFQLVYETEAEVRLNRLLMRQKFDEAEAFAKLFNLNPLDIHREKVQSIIDKISIDENDVNNLLNLLKTINDVELQIESCLKAHEICTNLVDVQKVLMYGASFNVLSNNTDTSCEVLGLQMSILKLLTRFYTFMELVKSDQKRNNIQNWVNFSECKITEELKKMLENHNIEESIIICHHLNSEIIEEFENISTHNILNFLNDVPIQKQLLFLCSFLPFILGRPSTLRIIVDWVVERIYQIERKHFNKFPDNAIDFVEGILQLLTDSNFLGKYLQAQWFINEKPLNNLLKYIRTLEKLKKLKYNYGITIPFDSFLEEPRVTLKILVDVATHIGSYNFLKEYLEELDLQISKATDSEDKDEIVSKVVKDIVQYQKGNLIEVVPMLLSSINSLDLKLNIVLTILRSSEIPWCTIVRKIADSALEYSHPLTEEIQREIEHEPRKVILTKEPYLLETNMCFKLSESLKFAIGRIIYCKQDTMVEDVYKICQNPVEVHKANILLLRHFVEEGDLQGALNILDNIDQEEVMRCLKEFLEIARTVINDQFTPSALKKSYYDALEPISHRIQSTSCQFLEKILQENITHMRNTYKKQEKFHSTSVIKNVDELLTEISRNYENRTISSIIKTCRELSICFNDNETRILLMFCEKINDFNVKLEILKKIYESETESNFLCEAVSVILQSFCTRNIFSNQRLSEFFNSQDIPVSNFLCAVKIGKELARKAILESNSDNVKTCMDLDNWIQTVSDFIPDRNIPLINNLTPNSSIFNALSNIYQFCVRHAENNAESFFVLSEVDLQLLHSTIKCLCTEGFTVTAYNLIITLQRSLIYRIDRNSHTNLNTLFNEVAGLLLQKIICAPNTDVEFALDLLLQLNFGQCDKFLFEKLKFYKLDFTKFTMIAKLYFQFLTYHNNERRQNLRQVLYQIKWWRKVSNHNLVYVNFFKKKPHECLDELIELSSIDLGLIQEFCSDFKLQVQEYYKQFLKNFLLKWKPKCKNTSNDKQIHLHTTNDDELFETCIEIINIIDDNDIIFNLMKEIWYKINFYHYEVFTCVFKIYSHLKLNVEKDQKCTLLNFLKEYNRVSKPSQREIEEWYSMHPDSQNIDPLSERRLPFTPTLLTNKIWKIVRPEINLKTYKQWIEATLIIPYLNTNSICSYVVKDVISSGAFQTKYSNNSIAQQLQENLLKEIDLCVQNMTNYEQATAALYDIISYVPKGLYQVNVIKLCYKYALEYKKECPQSKDVHVAFVKIQRKYFSYSVSYILSQNNITNKRYEEMVFQSPEELIEQLYMDDCIIEKAKFSTFKCPDINKAVNDISALYDFNVTKRRQTLVEQWLSSSAITDLLFEDYQCNNAILRETNNLQYLIRASYICSSDDISEWRDWLMNQSNETTNKIYKINLLKCFYTISDLKTIQDVTGLEPKQFRVNINKLILLNILENFGFNLTVDSLDSYKKIELLERISHNANTATGVKTMAAICITYEIYNNKPWNVILSSMCRLNMFAELQQCLNFLHKNNHFCINKIYVNSWQNVVDNWLLNSSISSYSNENLKELCMNHTRMIQNCPVLHFLNLEGVVKKLMDLEKYEFAALLLQYLSEEKQRNFILKIQECSDDVIDKLDNLIQHGYWNVLYVKNLLFKTTCNQNGTQLEE